LQTAISLSLVHKWRTYDQSLDPTNEQPSPWALPRILVIVVLVAIADNSALASIIVSCLVSLSDT